MRSNPNASTAGSEFRISGNNGISKYPAKSHARRIAEAIESPDGVIVLEGEHKAYYAHSDQARHFRQDRYFYYITGCNEPNCKVTYDIAKDKLTLWLPRADPARIFYDGRGSTPEEAMEKYDVDEARYLTPTTSTREGRPESLTFMLEAHRRASQKIWCLKRQDILQASLMDSFLLKNAMEACRAVKDADEIALIRKANNISSKAHLEVLKNLRHLKSEPEAEGIFLGTCITHGAKEQAYGPIVGSGPNAGILHYNDNNEAFGKRQVLLIDASCEWQLYAADITRTMPLNAKNPGHWPSKESEAVYKAVEAIQEACIKAIGPGKRFINANWLATHMAIDALLDLGILKGDHMEIFHQGTDRAFFPHGLGHHLGLEVHDMPPPTGQEMRFWAKFDFAGQHAAFAAEYAPQRQALPQFLEIPERWIENNFGLKQSVSMKPCTIESPPLEPGNVVTVEPGIYFNKFILDTVYLKDPQHKRFIDEEVLARYMPVGGVRIEDDILITEDGYENLTRALKGEDMLRAIRGEDVEL